MVAGAVGRRGADSTAPFAGILRRSQYGSRTWQKEQELIKSSKRKKPGGKAGRTSKRPLSSSDDGDGAASCSGASEGGAPDFWWSSDEDVLEPVSTSGVDSLAFADLFPDMDVADAVLDVVCRAAALSGKLSGDNRAVQGDTTSAEVEELAQEADAFITRHVAVLFGPLNTPKAHQIANHLLGELLDRGNLTEADTSVNEGLHSQCKAMYERTNKHVDSFTVQMLRHAQTLEAILADTPEPLEVPTGGPRRRRKRRTRQPAPGGATAAPDQQIADESADVRVRGQRVPVHELAVGDGGVLAGLDDVLRVGAHASVAVQNSLPFTAVFEWGASPMDLRVNASPMSYNKPYYDHVRYRDPSAPDGVAWGRARLVYDGIDGSARSGVVVQRLCAAEYKPGCVRTRHGDTRLRWDMDCTTGFPKLANVAINDVMRLEQIEPDFESLCARGGLFMTPDISPNTAEERVLERFFINSFHPWTSAKLKPL